MISIVRNEWIWKIIKKKIHFSKTFSSNLFLQSYSWKKPFTILGIETSCDDTCAAIVNSEGKILGEEQASNPNVHEKWGGIVPAYAARDHELFIDHIIDSSFRQSQKKWSDINGIAVTIGPGLSPCLRVGVNKAKELYKEYKIPIIPINHLEGHALVVRMDQKNSISFPFLVLLISGGHSQILLCRNVGDYLQLGGTLDDSLGESFDKVARLLGIDFSVGGKGLEEIAQKGDPDSFTFTIPLQKYKNCDFSFSGLKSAVARTLENEKKKGELTPQTASNIAASFQKTVLEHLQVRVARALNWCTEKLSIKLTNLVIAGGVARNLKLREVFQPFETSHQIKIVYPPLDLCTDNGVMIAWAAIEILQQDPNRAITDPVQIQNLEEKPKWPLSLNEDIFDTPYKQFLKVKRKGLRKKFIK